MASGYYVPSFFMHFFAMFGPSLLFGSTYHRLVMGLVFVSGPLVSEAITWGGGADVRAHEWQGVWCLFSAAQVGGTVCCGTRPADAAARCNVAMLTSV
jgi:hypothetical protein